VASVEVSSQQFTIGLADFMEHISTTVGGNNPAEDRIFPRNGNPFFRKMHYDLRYCLLGRTDMLPAIGQIRRETWRTGEMETIDNLLTTIGCPRSVVVGGVHATKRVLGEWAASGYAEDHSYHMLAKNWADMVTNGPESWRLNDLQNRLRRSQIGNYFWIVNLYCQSTPGFRLHVFPWLKRKGGSR
jgi:hypothetical protein